MGVVRKNPVRHPLVVVTSPDKAESKASRIEVQPAVGEAYLPCGGVSL